ncbi:hypothetical protein PTUN_a1217 [Pseudoalteromonas tunicata]|nr:hypothetical protein PTUN_a1217 [Pseudoalteromonas tunicata]
MTRYNKNCFKIKLNLIFHCIKNALICVFVPKIVVILSTKLPKSG